MEQKHQDRAHALLSASSSHRWLKCTKSARESDKIPSETSVYAEEGTLAHEYSEAAIKYQILQSITKEEFEQVICEIASHELFSDEIPEECSKYIDFIQDVYDEALLEDESAFLQVEQKVDYSDIAPEGFGTVDGDLVYGNTLHVIDLKYGKGVKVEANGNSQLEFYAYGSYLEKMFLYDIKHIKMTICQPRLDSITTYELTTEELLEKMASYKPIAELAFSGKGTFESGPHCKFCPCSAICGELASKNLEVVNLRNSDRMLTKEEISKIVLATPLIKSWLQSLGEKALADMLKGETYPNLKLVQGRSTRVWTSETEVIAALRDIGVSDDDIFDKKLKALTKIEKIVGKKRFASLDCVGKTNGTVKIASESSAGQSFSTAASDFAD